MTVKKAYQTLVITVLLMMSTIILYALNVSKLNLEWGMAGFTISAVLSIFSIILSIHTISHHREVKNTGFFALRRYEILDWFTFLSVSLMAIFMIFMFFVLPFRCFTEFDETDIAEWRPYFDLPFPIRTSEPRHCRASHP